MTSLLIIEDVNWLFFFFSSRWVGEIGLGPPEGVGEIGLGGGNLYLTDIGLHVAVWW